MPNRPRKPRKAPTKGTSPTRSTRGRAAAGKTDRPDVRGALRERVEHIVSTLETSLDDGSATPESVQHAAAAMTALEAITESDRLAHLTGTIRLFDAILTRLPSGEGAPLREQRATIAAIVERKYGSDAPYARSRDIVQQVAVRLKSGEHTDVVTEGALAEISALPFDDADVDEKATALLAVHALRAATDWLAAYDQAPNKLDPIPFALKLFATSLDAGGFNKDAALKSASQIRDGRLSLDGSRVGYLTALLISVGLALRAEPMALPALAQPILWLAEAANDAQADANAEAQQAEPASGIAAHCNAIVAQFTRVLEAHPFTEYDFRQAMASIQELSPQTPDDSSAMRDALLRVIDLSIAHAPRDWADTLAVVRKQIAGDDETGPAIDLATFELEGQQIVERFRSGLASAESPAAAFAQAQFDLQALAQRVPDGGNDDEAFGRVMMRFMVSLVEAMVPFAEAGKETLAADVVERLRNAMADMEGALGDDTAQTELAGRSAMQHFQTLLNQPLGDPFEQPDAPPYHRQFAAFFRLIAERTSRLNSDDILGARDAAECKRIESRLNVAFSRIRAATTEAQWIEQAARIVASGGV